MSDPIEFASRIAEARRIVIIGPCGAGKSTLARELGGLTGRPVVHLDRLYWKPGWVESEREDFRERQRAALLGEEWIVDGNYSATFDLRMPRADLLIWLDYPRRIYFRRVLLRVLKGYGRVRPDLGPGCPEQFDLEFLRFVWRFPTVSRPRTITALQEHAVGDRTLQIGSPRELARLMASLRRTV